MLKCKNYDNYYTNNALSFFLYKSGRKNAQCKYINAFHLIKPGDGSKQIDNDRILSQFVGVLETAVFYSKKYNHLEASFFVTFGKQEQYKNANGDLYGNVDAIRLKDARRVYYSLEDFINVLYNYFCLIYPYNTIARRELFNEASIKSIITDYYKKEV